ncbi:hypothetical protein [Endothiovibrio diazotrophicus]
MSGRFDIGWVGRFDRHSRGGRAALLALAALLFHALAIAPAIEHWRAGAERARGLRAEIAEERAVIAEGERIDRRAAAFGKALEERRALLPPAGEGDGQSYAALQEELGRLLQATGTELRNVTWGEAERVWGVVRLPMRVVVAGDPGAMAALVAAVTESPSMRFDELSLQRDPLGDRLVLIATLMGYRHD